MKILLSLACLLPCLPVHAALIADWRQDDVGGGLVDSTGGHPVGTVTGSVVFGQPGVPNGTYGSITVAGAAGTSIQYGPNVSDSFFQVGEDNLNPVMNVNASGSLTVMAWINPSAPDVAGRAYRPVSTGSSSGADRGWGFALRFADTVGTASVRFTTFGIADNDSDPFTVNFGEWVHIAATYDNGAINYFLNGDPLGGSDNSVFGNEAAAARLTVGARAGGNDFDQTNGLLDGVRVYDSALSTEEIRSAAVQSVIPEPGVGMLGLLGLALLAGGRRRRD